MERPDPESAARAFVARHFPDCHAAFLGGSVVRGDATAHSDLDIAILTESGGAPFRASYVEDGWPIEAFVHTRDSFRDFFERERQRRRPTLAMICVEGPILQERDGWARRIRAAAAALLAAGPMPLSPEERLNHRYRLTDLLDDFESFERQDEGAFLATALAGEAVSLLLATQGHWGGADKWIPRALRRFDPARADELAAALAAFFQEGERAPLVRFASAVLEPLGGRLFAGYWANPAGEIRIEK